MCIVFEAKGETEQVQEKPIGSVKAGVGGFRGIGGRSDGGRWSRGMEDEERKVKERWSN